MTRQMITKRRSPAVKNTLKKSANHAGYKTIHPWQVCILSHDI